MKKAFLPLFFALSAAFTLPQFLSAQCKTWLEADNRNDLQDHYVIYRDLMKKGDYEKAFPFWEKVYQQSPAADGQRSTVFSDGRKFYIEMFYQEKRKTRKSELVRIILRLLEEEKKCFPGWEITMPPKEILEFRSELN